MDSYQTQLAKKFAAHTGCTCSTCEGQGFTVLSEAIYGALEVVLTTGPKLAAMGIQRMYLTVQGPTGRLTMFYVDVPIEPKAEAGARVYKDRS